MSERWAIFIMSQENMIENFCLNETQSHYWNPSTLRRPVNYVDSLLEWNICYLFENTHDEIISPVKSRLAFGVVGHGNRIYGSNRYDWASTLPDAVMEGGGVIWSGGGDWGDKNVNNLAKGKSDYCANNPVQIAGFSFQSVFGLHFWSFPHVLPCLSARHSVTFALVPVSLMCLASFFLGLEFSLAESKYYWPDAASAALCRLVITVPYLGRSCQLSEA